MADGAGGHGHNITSYSAGGISRRDSGQQDTVLYNNDGARRSRTTDMPGVHTHTISGGDEETRPKSIAVMYIIKAK